MEFRARILAIACIVAGGVGFAVPAALSHPAWNPFDDTQFAPILRFGPVVGTELLTKGTNDEAGNPVGLTLQSPLKVVTAPGIRNHVFVVDQPGVVYAVNLTTGVRTIFLDATAHVITLGVCGPGTFDERGLIGLAFHPQYQQNGKFYTYTSELASAGVPTIPSAVAFDPDHHNVVSEWINASPGSPTSPSIGPRRQLMRVAWPQFNHDGGDLAFGPDGKLYISMGDGGGADDADGQDFILAQPKFPQQPDCSVVAPITGHQGNGNAQKLNTALGKIHRIDVNPPFSPGKQYRVPGDNPFVNTANAVPEIWAYGFRNPYRTAFDRKRGTLYTGDVGQNDIEEIDVVKRGGNFGWNCKEGTLFFWINGNAEGFASRDRDPARADCRGRRLVEPVAQYDTHHEGHSAIGGDVYHGDRIPELRGKYVFGDFARLFKFPRGPHDYGRVFSMDSGDDDGLRRIRELIFVPSGNLNLSVLGLGLDARGEIYVTGNVTGTPFGNTGVVVRIAPAENGGSDD